MKRATRRRPARGLLDGARVYLSGPMDFVADREYEMKYGWRSRIGTILRSVGCVVFDPWQKPEVRGLNEYGREGVDTTRIREAWVFHDGARGAKARAKLTGKFWETLHIDLRMVDTSDFVIAYCPTNVYSVGTPHEIALARLQRKPVLFVSPSVEFPAHDALKAHLARDREGLRLLADLEKELPIKPNEPGIPSLWYMPLVGGENFFDGFGFTARLLRKHRWPPGPLDARERKRKPVRPLLPFLESLTRSLPKKWDNRLKRFVKNDDWLLWDLQPSGRGARITDARKPR
jgi:hypothetical protein